MEPADHYVPYNVYTNIGRCLGYRNLLLVEGSHYAPRRVSGSEAERHKEMMNQDTFKRAMQQHQFVMMIAKDSPKHERRYPDDAPEHVKELPTYTWIIQTAPGANFLTKTDPLKKLMVMCGLDRPPMDHNLDVLLVYSREGLKHRAIETTVRKSLERYTHTGITTPTEPDETPTQTGMVTITTVPYSIFVTERPRHVLCVPHIALTKAEEKEVLRQLRVTKRDLPFIRSTDAMAIWYGLQIGGIVKIIADSETTGHCIEYRVVYPGQEI